MANVEVRVLPAMTDEMLAEAARKGDTSAYATLVERYRGTAFACAYVHLRSREDAEDVVQEAFVRAYEALGRQRHLRSWAAWFLCIVRNLCRDVGRRRAVRDFFAMAARDQPEPVPRAPETELFGSELERTVREAVDELPDVLRMPVLLHYGYGLTYEEIAVALGVKHSTVVGRLAGALRRLRRIVESEARE